MVERVQEISPGVFPGQQRIVSSEEGPVLEERGWCRFVNSAVSQEGYGSRVPEQHAVWQAPCSVLCFPVFEQSKVPWRYYVSTWASALLCTVTRKKLPELKQEVSSFVPYLYFYSNIAPWVVSRTTLTGAFMVEISSIITLFNMFLASRIFTCYQTV